VKWSTRAEHKKEIEKKFIVLSDTWRGMGSGTSFRQGYLSTEPARTVRIRIQRDRATLTIKGMKVGDTALKFDYDIPLDDAAFLLRNLCIQPVLEKTRFRVHGPDGQVWAVDQFHGANLGLVLAEIELADESESFERPPWVGYEVTDDFRYSNSRLTEKPFSTWDAEFD
jgi:adenylate cyclase